METQSVLFGNEHIDAASPTVSLNIREEIECDAKTMYLRALGCFRIHQTRLE